VRDKDLNTCVEALLKKNRNDGLEDGFDRRELRKRFRKNKDQ
jgi:hypothetical protein